MYKLLRIASIFIISNTLFSCNKPDKKIERFKDGTIAIVYEYPDRSDTSTFTYIENYPTGKIHIKFSAEKHIIIGTPLVYYPSGKIYEIDSIYGARNVDSPSWNGRITRFYENGKIQKVLQVKQGIIRGLAKTYDSNGILLKEYFLTRDSIKNGPYTEFYPSGAIMTKASFENDTLNGMMYFFSEKGDTTKYYNRDKGDIVMPYKKWLDDGTVLLGNYTDKNGKEILWRWYTKEGKIIKKRLQRIKDEGSSVPE